MHVIEIYYSMFPIEEEVLSHYSSFTVHYNMFSSQYEVCSTYCSLTEIHKRIRLADGLSGIIADACIQL